jgi:hypothetical protein
VVQRVTFLSCKNTTLSSIALCGANVKKKSHSQKAQESVLAAIVTSAQDPIETAAEAKRLRRSLLDVLDESDGITVSIETVKELRSWGLKELREWRDQFRVFLLLNVGRTSDQPSPVVTIHEIKAAVNVDDRGGVSLMAYGAAHDVVAFQILGLLRMAGVARLRRCRCGRVFFKVHKREFHSTKCQKMFYMRDDREADRLEGVNRGKTKSARRR